MVSNLNKINYWIGLMSGGPIFSVLRYFRSLNLVICECCLNQMTGGWSLWFKHDPRNLYLMNITFREQKLSLFLL